MVRSTSNQVVPVLCRMRPLRSKIKSIKNIYIYIKYNHWCTFSRFGNKDHPCCFGCGHNTDRIAHTLACPKFLDVFFGTCGIERVDIEFEEIAMLHGPWVGSCSQRAKFLILASHVCFLSYHACKHGTPFSARLVLHKLYHYTRRHYKTANFVRHFKYKERYRLQQYDG